MINIAFVGFKHNHIYSLYNQAKANPDVQIIAAYEEDPGYRKTAFDKYGIGFTHNSFEQLLQNKEINAIALGDYYAVRGSQAIEALKAGKHVISDKPLCTSLNELDEITALSHKKNLTVSLMLDLRFNQNAQHVRKIVSENIIGEIQNIFFSGQHPLSYGTRASWYFEEGKHGGTINDIAIHGIDLIRYITGLTLKRIIASRCWNAYAIHKPEFKDCAQFMIEMSNGAGLMADVSYSAPDITGSGLPSYWRFTLWGLKGFVEFDINSDNIIVARAGQKEIETIKTYRIEHDNVLSSFVDEINGKDARLCTASVLKSTKDTLLIQQASE